MQYHLAFSTDQNYLPYLFVLCQSILDHLETNDSNDSDELVFNVIVDQSVDMAEIQPKIDHFSQRNQESLVPFKFKFHQIDQASFNGFNPLCREDKIVFSTYYRILLDKILASDVEKVLYLDIDIMLLTDVRNIFSQHPLKNQILGAVFDRGIESITIPPFKTDVIYASSKDNSSSSQQLAIPVNNYFNAGVLLINLVEWRKFNVGEKCLELGAKWHFRLHDQDMLNYLCQGKIDLMEDTWNYQFIMFALEYNPDTKKYDHTYGAPNDRIYRHHTLTAEEFLQSRNSINLIHFVGLKPWQYAYKGVETDISTFPLPDDYLQYCKAWLNTAAKVTEFSILSKLVNQFAGSYQVIKLRKIDADIASLKRKTRKRMQLQTYGLVFLLLLNIITLGLFLTQ